MPDFITWLTVGFDVFMQLARLTLDYLKILAWPAVVPILALAFRRLWSAPGPDAGFFEGWGWKRFKCIRRAPT